MFVFQREALLEMGEHFHNIARAGLSLTSSTVEMSDDSDGDGKEFALSAV